MRLPKRQSPHEGATRKPTVLLADDHPDILKSLTRLLSFDFEVVAAASSGEEALEDAFHFDPDIALLDITMPGRDGFQTARDLRQRAVRARIVFLTMHESEEFVTEAFRSGGQGYVIKTRLHADLIRALQRVLAGQIFLPSLRSLFAIDDSPRGHVLQLHADEATLVDSVGSFLNTALRRGDAVSMVSTAPVRANLAKLLEGFGWTVGESGDFGRYRASDSVAAASSVVSAGHSIRDQIASYVADLDRWRAATAGPQARLTLVGDIATQLVLDGHVDAAMEVEHHWSDLTQALPFLTVCCYPMASFEHDPQQMLPHLCAEHFAVAHTPEGGMPSSI